MVATVLAAAPPAWEAAFRAAHGSFCPAWKSKAGQAVSCGAGQPDADGNRRGSGAARSRLVTSFAGHLRHHHRYRDANAPGHEAVDGRDHACQQPAGGVLGRMAPRSVVNSLSRTAIAIAALMIAVSVTIGVSLMVGSFRHTVVYNWLSQTVQGDVYISPPSKTASSNTGIIDPAASTPSAWPGVERVDLLRSATVDSPDGPLQVAAVDNPSTGDERLFVVPDGPPEAVGRRCRQARSWCRNRSPIVSICQRVAAK